MNNFPPSSPPVFVELDACALFDGLNKTELTAVTHAAKMRKINAGECFFHEGEPAETVYVLYSGVVRLLQTAVNGRQVIMNLCTPGQEMALVAALNNTVNMACAEAIKDSTAYVWDKATIRQLMHSYPAIALNGIGIIAKRFQNVQDRYREMATEPVEQRVAHTLLRLAARQGLETETGVNINMPLTRQDIAQMTGTTLYTVSRILSKWEHAGWVHTGRQSVEIASRQQIEHIANHPKQG